MKNSLEREWCNECKKYHHHLYNIDRDIVEFFMFMRQRQNVALSWMNNEQENIQEACIQLLMDSINAENLKKLELSFVHDIDLLNSNILIDFQKNTFFVLEED